MLLKDLFEDKKDKNEKNDDSAGSYLAVSFTEDSQDALYAYAKSLQIPNLVPKDKYHSTIIYSTKPLPKDFKARGDITEDKIFAKPDHLSIFPTQSGDKQALVLETDCSDLDNRHSTLMKQHDLKYDFDTYKSHITLSYDIGEGEFDIEAANKKLSGVSEIQLADEYHDELQTDWVKNNT